MVSKTSRALKLLVSGEGCPRSWSLVGVGVRDVDGLIGFLGYTNDDCFENGAGCGGVGEEIGVVGGEWGLGC